MTVKELKKQLEKLSDNLEVKVDLKRNPTGGMLVSSSRIEKNSWEDFVTIVVDDFYLRNILEAL